MGGAKGHCMWQLDRSGGVLPQKIFEISGVIRDAIRGIFGTIFKELFLCKYLPGSKVIVDVSSRINNVHVPISKFKCFPPDYC